MRANGHIEQPRHQAQRQKLTDTGDAQAIDLNEPCGPRLKIVFEADHISHAMWRVINLPPDKIKPKVAVVMIGTADVPHHIGFTPQQLANSEKELVKQLQLKFPGVKVLLLGIFPRMEQDDAAIEKIKNVNAIMSKFDDGKSVFFMDVGSKFEGADGRVSPKIMPDGLHLSEDGYAIWGKAMEPKLVELLGSTSPSN